MNFAAMLQATVTPLADIEPPCQKRQRQVAQASHARKAKVELVKREDTLAKYRAAWQGEEWAKTSAIEKRLGYTPSSCLPTLRRWEAEGLLESRKVVGANGRHKRSMGIEWKWKSTKQENQNGKD